MSSAPKVVLTKVEKWAPNGPQDYARTVRKYNITPSSHQTVIFTRDSKLIRVYPTDGKKQASLLDKFKHIVKRGEQNAQVVFKGAGGIKTVDKARVDPASGEGEVPADDVQNDLEYVVPVKVGTPGVSLKLDFDTGSSDLWVFSTALKLSTEQEKEHTIYDPSASSTAKLQSHEKWNISYGDGSSASGTVYHDSVTVGDVTIAGQGVEAATKASSSFLSPGSDGLLGLAWPALNTVTPSAEKTPVEQMIAQKLIAQPLFTVKLDKAGGSDEGGSFYTFGTIDSSVALTGDITYVDVDNSNGFWEFPTKSLKIGSTTLPRRTTAIADTGTTLLLLEDAAVEAIYKQIKGAKLSNTAGGWVVPAGAAVGDLGVEVGGVTYTIPGEDIKFADNGDGTFYGSVQSRGNNPQDIWGDVFLKRVYTVFNVGEKKIGFGQRAKY
ncbi:hypothetical protein PLICRDRAFT_179353 [Plicaturopsis crispa FD-325 SS-3]|uniref:Peptidase A1 domain-containing protein n=1 Tax=Plicaturopsis crispa FD-325 SS-3 TaxID=944288 RepID=A0A0C9SXQ4_PLICR|nr:hypothetical protein PLICRDRAFT_179353 [Plicaturopsis crispa FD-325 SS-3]